MAIRISGLGWVDGTEERLYWLGEVFDSVVARCVCF